MPGLPNIQLAISLPLRPAREAVRPASERLMVGYLMTLVTAALCVSSILVASGQGLRHVLPIAALAIVASLSERGSVRLTSTTETSIALLPVIFAAVLFGPLAGMIVGAASMVTDFRAPYMKWGVYTSSRAITGGLAGVAAATAIGVVANDITAIVVATVVGAVVAEGVDAGFAAITHRLRGNGAPGNLIRVAGPLVLAALPMYVPVVALLAVAYKELSVWTLPLFFVPALAAQRLFILYREQRQLAEDLGRANVRLERANLSFATALVATLDARDRYTAGHSAAVAVYARDIAARMELTLAEQDLAHVGGLVHDIGKVGLPPGLLEKPGPLTLEERRLMEDHSTIGERILANVDGYAEIAHVVRHHHERVDGNGYPDRLAGGGIPLISRILAVADAYDAMTSDRPYRDAMPSRVARLRLAQAVETQFDTSVVAAFEAILAAADQSYREGSINPAFEGSINEVAIRVNESLQRLAV
jgi:putative nucleotidyltransferase with HDIG domain